MNYQKCAPSVRCGYPGAGGHGEGHPAGDEDPWEAHPPTSPPPTSSSLATWGSCGWASARGVCSQLAALPTPSVSCLDPRPGRSKGRSQRNRTCAQEPAVLDGGGGGQKVLPVGLTPPTHLLRAASRPQKLQVRPPPLALSTTIGHLPPSQDALGFLSLPPVFPNLPFTSAPTSTCWGSTSRRPLGCSGLFRLPAPLPPGIHGRDVSMALLTAPPGSPVLFGRPQGLALITGHKGSQISLQPRLLPEMQDSRTQVPTEQLHWV